MKPEEILEKSGPLPPHHLAWWMRCLNDMTKREVKEELFHAVCVRETVKMRWDGTFGLEMD